jgi:hypothetical protein
MCAWAMDESEAHLHAAKLTREHVLGRQFEPLVEGPGPYTYERIRLDAARKAMDSYRSWTSDQPVDWVTKAFCEDCNGGWMATVDNRARPVVEKLMARGPSFEMTDERETSTRSCVRCSTTWSAVSTLLALSPALMSPAGPAFWVEGG